jgi:hypothetical protein
MKYEVGTLSTGTNLLPYFVIMRQGGEHTHAHTHTRTHTRTHTHTQASALARAHTHTHGMVILYATNRLHDRPQITNQ